MLRRKWLRGQWKRVSPTCRRVGMEACVGGHHLKLHDAPFDVGEVRAPKQETNE
jgi:hypothetical protein